MPIEPWAMYPPELNAGRMTAGAGTFSWELAAAAWDQVAAIIDEQLIVLGAESVAILATWEGLSGLGTAASTAPYVAWLFNAGQAARKNAAAARWVVQSFTTSQATMIPVPNITQNRVAVQVAKAQAAASAASAVVFPGAAASHAQAMATIAEKEAQYAMYWQQNSTVMAKYDAEITTATTPIPLPDPPSIIKNGEYGGVGTYDPNSNGLMNDYRDSLEWTSPKYDTYSPEEGTYQGSDYNPGVNYKDPSYTSDYKGTDFTYTPGDYDGSSYNPGHYEGGNYTPGTTVSGGEFVPGAFAPGQFSGASSSTFTPSRVSVGGTSAPSNALGRAGSIIGRGGITPSFGTQANSAAMRATGGLGMGAKAAPAFGGVQNSPTTTRAPLSSGMGMAPGAAGGQRRNSQNPGGVEGDVRDHDSDIYQGIDVIDIASAENSYEENEDTYSPKP